MSKGRIQSINSEELQCLLNTSSSYAEVIRRLGLVVNGLQHRRLKECINEKKLSIEKMEQNRRQNKSRNGNKYRKTPIKSILVEGSTFNRSHLKTRLLSENLLEYKCQRCGNTGEWLGEKLSLHLDHINGINNDNRLENLRFLCPNCHALTETYSGKNCHNREKKKWTCKQCNKDISVGSVHCSSCVFRPKKFGTTKKELEELVKIMSMAAIGRKFGVSCNAIRKRCRKLGIEWKKFPAPK